MCICEEISAIFRARKKNVCYLKENTVTIQKRLDLRTETVEGRHGAGVV